MKSHKEFPYVLQPTPNCAREQVLSDLHLDVFDQIIPFSVISQVLSTCDAWEKREHNLNMVAVIWMIIAMGLLPSLSIPHVLQKMAQGLRSIWPDPNIRLPTASALSYRRQR